MKGIFKTGMVVVALAGIMALTAGTALAAPQPLGPEAIDPGLDPAVPGENEQPGDNSLADDCASVRANGYSHIGTINCDDGGDNPGNFDTPQIPEIPQQTTEIPQVPSSKLPNTGSHLVLLAGLGLALAAASFGARRVIMKRAR